jgi:hypothetical protein
VSATRVHMEAGEGGQVPLKLAVAKTYTTCAFDMPPRVPLWCDFTMALLDILDSAMKSKDNKQVSGVWGSLLDYMGKEFGRVDHRCVKRWLGSKVTGDYFEVEPSHVCNVEYMTETLIRTFQSLCSVLLYFEGNHEYAGATVVLVGRVYQMLITVNYCKYTVMEKAKVGKVLTHEIMALFSLTTRTVIQVLGGPGKRVTEGAPVLTSLIMNYELTQDTKKPPITAEVLAVFVVLLERACAFQGPGSVCETEEEVALLAASVILDDVICIATSFTRWIQRISERLVRLVPGGGFLLSEEDLRAVQMETVVRLCQATAAIGARVVEDRTSLAWVSFADIVKVVRNLAWAKANEVGKGVPTLRCVDPIVNLDTSVVAASTRYNTTMLDRKQHAIVMRCVVFDDMEQQRRYLLYMGKRVRSDFLCGLTTMWIFSNKHPSRWDGADGDFLIDNYFNWFRSVKLSTRMMALFNEELTRTTNTCSRLVVYDTGDVFNAFQRIVQLTPLGTDKKKASIVEFAHALGDTLLQMCESTIKLMASSYGSDTWFTWYDIQFLECKARCIHRIVKWWIKHEARMPCEPLIPVARWVMQQLEVKTYHHNTQWMQVRMKLILLPVFFGVSAGEILKRVEQTGGYIQGAFEPVDRRLETLRGIDAREQNRWSEFRKGWVQAVARGLMYRQAQAVGGPRRRPRQRQRKQ